MKVIMLLVLAGIILSTGCSGGDDATATGKSSTAATSKTAAGAETNVLSGYKTALDTAKSVSSMAGESEKKKNQAVQDLQ